MYNSIEKLEVKWLQDRKKIPNLNFPKEWNIRLWPPFTGATVRFQVNDKISVYLDMHDNLGSIGLGGEPYWEIYPYKGDTCRVGMLDTAELIEQIQVALDTYVKPEKDEARSFTQIVTEGLKAEKEEARRKRRRERKRYIKKF